MRHGISTHVGFLGNAVRETLRRAAVGLGAPLLDVAAGTGTLAAKPNGLCVELDQNPNPKHENRVVGRIERAPFRSVSFTSAVFANTLWTLPPDQWVPVLTEIRRLLRPGGVLLVDIRNRNNLGEWLHDLAAPYLPRIESIRRALWPAGPVLFPRHFYAQDPRDFGRLVRSLRFRIDAVTPIGGLVRPRAYLLRLVAA